MNPVRIALVDDHPVVLAGIRALLQGITEVELVGEANTAATGLKAICESSPDIAVIDLASWSVPVLSAATAAGCRIWCDIHDYDGEADFHRPFIDAADVLVVSGHNALGYLGGPPPGTQTVVVVGARLTQVAGEFTTCTTADRLDSGLGVDNEEEGQPIALCTGPKQDWSRLWPVLRHLS